MGVSLTYEQGNYVTIDAAVLITVLSLLFMHKLQRTRGRELEVSSVDQSTVTGCPKDQIKCIRSRCKDRGGASICEHNRRRCKDRGGASICEHNRRRSSCKDCGELACASIIAKGANARSAGAPASAIITAQVRRGLR